MLTARRARGRQLTHIARRGQAQLPQDSLQQKELCRNSLQSLSDQLSRIILDSLIIQLDLVTSLSLTWFGSTRCRQQLQSLSFDRSSFEYRALPCAALLDKSDQKSFQLTKVQLWHSLAQGGASPHRALLTAWGILLPSTALTLISLSFANDAWLKTSSKRAWSRRSLTRPSSTPSSTTASTTTSNKLATSSLRRTLLSVVWFSFLFSNFFLSSSFWKQEVADKDELSQTVWEQELVEHLTAKPLQQDQLQQNKFKEKNKKKKQQDQLSASVPDRELSQLHLSQLHDQDQPFTGTKHLPEEQCFTSCLLRQMISSFSKKELERLHLTRSSLEQNLSQVQLVYYKFFSENFGQQLSEKQLQQNLSTDQQQLQDSNLAQIDFQQLSFSTAQLHRDDLEQ